MKNRSFITRTLVVAGLLPAIAIELAADPLLRTPRSDWTVTQTLWDSGPYAYDGAGYVASIGTDVYRYDLVGRLKSATAGTVPPSAGQLPANEQKFDYDRYGNLLSMRVATAQETKRYDFAVDKDTNQLGLECATANACFTGFYDPATGNQLGRAGGGEYVWDSLGLLAELNTSRRERYISDANDERILVVDEVANSERYTLRGPTNRVARVLSRDRANSIWKLDNDYVYRGGTLMASFSGAATTPDRHYHTDHLGTTRLVTDASGSRMAIHTYWPFGPEAAGSERDGERVKFTGHERDSSPATSPGSDLDYMHARYYDANAGRFLSIDRAAAAPATPQSWNRYSYVRNNPMNFVDPDGNEPLNAHMRQFLQAFLHADLSHVDVYGGWFASSLTRLAGGVQGITLGQNIFFDRSSFGEYKARSGEGIALTGHEATHTMQYAMQGFFGFIRNYLGDYLENRRAGMSAYDAYRKTGAEVEAYANDHALRQFLALNLEILTAVQQGISLTPEQLDVVSRQMPQFPQRQQQQTFVRMPDRGLFLDVLEHGQNLYCYNGGCF
jgi:RHS repeat-associated protein